MPKWHEKTWTSLSSIPMLHFISQPVSKAMGERLTFPTVTRMTQITDDSPLCPWLLSPLLSSSPPFGWTEQMNVSDPWDVLPILRAITNIPWSLHQWKDPIILPLHWNALHQDTVLRAWQNTMYNIYNLDYVSSLLDVSLYVIMNSAVALMLWNLQYLTEATQWILISVQLLKGATKNTLMSLNHSAPWCEPW